MQGPAVTGLDSKVRYTQTAAVEEFEVLACHFLKRLLAVIAWKELLDALDLEICEEERSQCVTEQRAASRMS
jgi:hypothetical protein